MVWPIVIGAAASLAGSYLSGRNNGGSGGSSGPGGIMSSLFGNNSNQSSSISGFASLPQDIQTDMLDSYYQPLFTDFNNLQNFTPTGFNGIQNNALQTLSGGFSPYDLYGLPAFNFGVKGDQSFSSGYNYLTQAPSQLGLANSAIGRGTSAITDSEFGNMYGRFSNPFTTDVIGGLASDLMRQRGIMQNDVNAGFSGSGSFGSARQGIREAELDKNLLDTFSKTAAGLRADNYNYATGMAQNALDTSRARDLSGATSYLSGGNMLTGIGSALTGLGGAQMDARQIVQGIRESNRANEIQNAQLGLGVGDAYRALAESQRLGPLDRYSFFSNGISPFMSSVSQGQNAGGGLLNNSGFTGLLGSAMSSLGSSGGGSGGFLSGIGSAIGGLFSSDARTKEDLKYVGNKNGHAIFEFSYKADKLKKKYRGVVAQLVKLYNPEAVVFDKELGIYKVNYGALGIDMEIVGA